MNEGKSLVLPFAVMALVTSVLFFAELKSSFSTVHREYLGTVCCLSEKLYIEGAGRRHSPHKMMVVVLDDGRRVDVPILDVPYIKGKRMIVRETDDGMGTTKFWAKRYLSTEGT